MPNSQTRLLRAAALPDNFTRSLYKIAPYKGCGHGCRYCDGRAERYYVEGDFECDIEIRRNIPQRLEAELPTLRERGIIAFGSGVTVPYQPLEATEGLMGRCAEILADSPFPFPALVMTKSSLALRDLPLWEKVKDRAGFILLVSISSLDESIRRVMEPGASSFQARLDMLKAFKEAGCIVGILAMPLLPGISDNEASIRRLYTACVDIGTDFVLPGGLTLRPGRQKDFFLKSLGSYRPDLLKKTEELYSEEKYRDPLGKKFQELCLRGPHISVKSMPCRIYSPSKNSREFCPSMTQYTCSSATWASFTRNAVSIPGLY